MIFATRAEAGRLLAQQLARSGIPVDILFGLPRGGILVGAPVAQQFKCPLRALMVRKIGHPFNREFAVGALTQHAFVLDVEALAPLQPSEIEDIIRDERERLLQYEQKFSGPGLGEVKGRSTWIVDDGLATGATMEAAVKELKTLGAAQVRVAVPVASVSAAERLAAVADGVITLLTDPHFVAVGRYYKSFPQASDQEVELALRQCRPAE
jgi:putative phosphoribosyl transferase